MSSFSHHHFQGNRDLIQNSGGIPKQHLFVSSPTSRPSWQSRSLEPLNHRRSWKRQLNSCKQNLPSWTLANRTFKKLGWAEKERLRMDMCINRIGGKTFFFGKKTWKAHQHFVQVVLPTTQFQSAMASPLHVYSAGFTTRGELGSVTVGHPWSPLEPKHHRVPVMPSKPIRYDLFRPPVYTFQS